MTAASIFIGDSDRIQEDNAAHRNAIQKATAVVLGVQRPDDLLVIRNERLESAFALR